MKQSNMKQSKAVKVVVTVIYIVGICITAYLGVKCFLPSVSEPDPMAMIPFTENEKALITMALGFPFMLASSLLVIWAYELRKSGHSRRGVFFALIPAIIDGIPFLIVAGVITVMMAKGYLEALGLLP